MRLYYEVVGKKCTMAGGIVHYVEAYRSQDFQMPPGVPYKPILESKFCVYLLSNTRPGSKIHYLEDGTAPNVDIIHSIVKYNERANKEADRKYIAEQIAAMKAELQE